MKNVVKSFRAPVPKLCLIYRDRNNAYYFMRDRGGENSLYQIMLALSVQIKVLRDSKQWEVKLTTVKGSWLLWSKVGHWISMWIWSQVFLICSHGQLSIHHNMLFHLIYIAIRVLSSILPTFRKGLKSVYLLQKRTTESALPGLCLVSFQDF